jgi:hypothetical protein
MTQVPAFDQVKISRQGGQLLGRESGEGLGGI